MTELRKGNILHDSILQNIKKEQIHGNRKETPGFQAWGEVSDC